MADAPKSLEPHQVDYLPEIWNEYSIQELGTWVHLFVKRAGHRRNQSKARKDLYDAQNYLDMMQAKLDEAKGMFIHD